MSIDDGEIVSRSREQRAAFSKCLACDRSHPAPLEAALKKSGVDYREPGIFWYEAIEGTEDLGVNVSWTAGADPHPGTGWEFVELPGAERAMRAA